MIREQSVPDCPLPVLHRRFTEEHEYRASAGASYSLLPLRFIHLDADRYLVTNLVGEHVVTDRSSLDSFIRKKLRMHSPLYSELKSKHFLWDADSAVALDLLATKYRTKQAPLSQFTSLHMFVTTLRCDHTCPYCQVSRQTEDAHAYDMTTEIADRAVDFMFMSPSPLLKVEFQGGESLLNFGIVRYIVERVEVCNKDERRDIEFVIATNLAPLTDSMLDFCLDHNVLISTSLDGPEALHNANRPRPGRNSYLLAVDGIKRVREKLGPHRIAALMTTTRASLSQPRAIIDEYIQQGFRSIFLRMISPYGFATRTGMSGDYTADEWLDFYYQALDYILELNYGGLAFVEEYAAIILRKILTPYGTGFVDLRSPAGIGIAGIIYNYDGGVYASDESRMLAEMGDDTFRMGDLLADTYSEIMLSPALVEPLGGSIAECVPYCSDCGLLPYCGSDPCRHHRTHGDFVGFKPTSAFCIKNMGVIKHLIRLLEDDKDASRVLKSWGQPATC